MKVYFDYNKQAITKVEDGSSVYMGDLTTTLEVIANADIHTTHYVLVSAKLPNGRIIGPFLSDPDIQETANVNEGTEYTVNPDSTTWKFTMTPENGFKFVKGLTNLYIWLCTTDGKRKCLGAVNFNVNEAHAYDGSYFISVDETEADEVLTNMEAQIAQLQEALQNVTLIEGNPEEAVTDGQLKKVLIGTKVYYVVNEDDLANYQSKIDGSHKLSSDLVDDAGHTNKFVTEQDKTTWNAKQNAIDSSHKLNADLVDDTNAAHKFASSGQLTAINQAGYDGAGVFEPNADIDMAEHSKTLYVDSSDVILNDRQESLGSALNGIEDDIADIDDDKLAKKPNGTDDLISNGKINTSYIPDAVLGQLLFGGVVTGEGYALLTPAAKSRLGTSQDNIQLTNDNTAITGYGANASIFYVMLSNGSFASLGLKTGDWLISLGGSWAKVDNTDEVTSVNGSTGAVTITAASLGALTSVKKLKTSNTTSQTTSTGEDLDGSGTINLHRISKTGKYTDLIGIPIVSQTFDTNLSVDELLSDLDLSTGGARTVMVKGATLPLFVNDVPATVLVSTSGGSVTKVQIYQTVNDVTVLREYTSTNLTLGNPTSNGNFKAVKHVSNTGYYFDEAVYFDNNCHIYANNAFGYFGSVYVASEITCSELYVSTFSSTLDVGDSLNELWFNCLYQSNYNYHANDITIYNHRLFISLVDNNTGNTPDTTQDTAYWARVFV